VSEFDDSASTASASDRISKEHVYNAYQKMRARYHKYKGRYADLAKHYRELEREREKVKVTYFLFYLYALELFNYQNVS